MLWQADGRIDDGIGQKDGSLDAESAGGVALLAQANGRKVPTSDASDADPVVTGMCWGTRSGLASSTVEDDCVPPYRCC